MGLTSYTLSHRSVTWMLTLLLVAGGILAFKDLGRLEDPEFTIKQALIIVRYPGASALEVEEEVTLPIENAIQQLPYVDNIRSTSSNGLSQVRVEMKSIYRKRHLAQIWDEMRRKINDLAPSLPPGVMPVQIVDDFGDVYGIFMAVTGEGYSYRALEDYADYLRRELVLVPGVSKVVVGGARTQLVAIEIDRARLAASGFSPAELQAILSSQNLVSPAGHLRVGSEYLRISAESSEKDPVGSLANLLLGSRNGKLIYLRDVADVRLDYADPPAHLYRFDGQPALSLGVSFASGVNVVEVGERIAARLAELEPERPVGMSLHTIYNQPEKVDAAVNDFLISLAQAVVIVIFVLLLTMGWRAGLLMSGVLLLTILGTFIVMRVMAIDLHRISLGALIIALGMLVDNAIVVTEGIMVSLQRGVSRTEAALRVVSHTRWPLLGATIIAITAFAPIGLSPDASGEFTGSLFWVLLISLALSWLFAITLTPFFCVLMFREQGEGQAPERDPYRGLVYELYRGLLAWVLRNRVISLALVVAALVAGIAGFTKVKQAFFPASSLPMFMLEYRLPEGSDIRALEAEIAELEAMLLERPEVRHVTATLGRGAERFMLTYGPELSNSSYGQLVVEATDFDAVGALIRDYGPRIRERFPHAFIKFQRFELGPASAAKIEARITGPDPEVLRRLALPVMEILEAEPEAINVRQNWREKTKLIRPRFNEAEGRRLGITPRDFQQAIAMQTTGLQTGIYRNGSQLLPIVIRPPKEQRSRIDELVNMQIYSPVRQGWINIGQVMLDVEVGFEENRIQRRDRKRTLSVLADPVPGVTPATLHRKVRGAIEALPLPEGYSLSWGGEYEAQQKANKAVFAFVPLGVLIMWVLTVMLFRSVLQALIVWITVPLSIIGVTAGLLAAGAPFSFMALLALLSLIGMQLKNGIVLVEEIKRLRDEERLGWYQALTEAAVSRLRPVTMAALTTILGMVPLLTDVFFQPMAVTIMAGLGFATLLTLVVIPLLFALFYRVHPDQR